MSKGNIDERLIALINWTTSPAKRFKELEEKTGISSNRWQSVWHARQRAMPDMIEIIGRLYPEYAFWLVTGISDFEHGHNRPGPHGSFRPRTAAKDLFLARIDELLWLEMHPFTKEDMDKYLATLGSDSSAPMTCDMGPRIQHWMNMTLKIDQLQEIRDAQELALKKFETETAINTPIAF